jgi:hypothetical protein
LRWGSPLHPSQIIFSQDHTWGISPSFLATSWDRSMWLAIPWATWTFPCTS